MFPLDKIRHNKPRFKKKESIILNMKSLAEMRALAYVYIDFFNQDNDLLFQYQNFNHVYKKGLDFQDELDSPRLL